MISDEIEQRIGEEIVGALKKTPLWDVILDLAHREYQKGYDHGFQNGQGHQRQLYKERERKKAKK